VQLPSSFGARNHAIGSSTPSTGYPSRSCTRTRMSASGPMSSSLRGRTTTAGVAPSPESRTPDRPRPGCPAFVLATGGGYGIRTREGCYTQHDFQSCALGRSANPPRTRVPDQRIWGRTGAEAARWPSRLAALLPLVTLGLPALALTPGCRQAAGFLTDGVSLSAEATSPVIHLTAVPTRSSRGVRRLEGRQVVGKTRQRP